MQIGFKDVCEVNTQVNAIAISIDATNVALNRWQRGPWWHSRVAAHGLLLSRNQFGEALLYHSTSMLFVFRGTEKCDMARLLFLLDKGYQSLVIALSRQKHLHGEREGCSSICTVRVHGERASASAHNVLAHS